MSTSRFDFVGEIEFYLFLSFGLDFLERKDLELISLDGFFEFFHAPCVVVGGSVEH